MRMNHVMRQRATGFEEATKAADHDFVTFGNCVIQVAMNRKRDNLYYACWHLRDCAWHDNEAGMVDTFYRKWQANAIDLVRMFPKTVSSKVRDLAKEDPYRKVLVWHCILPTDAYEIQCGEYELAKQAPWVSIFVDVDHEAILEEVPIRTHQYVVARWRKISGSPYATSPAVTAGISDARTLQEMTDTLLEAGEKATSPPMLAVQGALRSDIDITAAGVTWVDREYDERLGEVLRPLSQDTRGIPLGLEMQRETKADLETAFYINKLNLPPQQPGTTAYEIAERVQEYVRQALPLFAPVEVEYNTPLCELTFDNMLIEGGFGPLEEIPESLRGSSVKFTFESPLHDALEKALSQRFLESTSMMASAAAGDPSVVHLVDVKKAVREAMLGMGVPAGWLRSEYEVAQLTAADAQRAQIAELLGQMQQGADIAKTIGTAPAPAGTGGTGIAI